MTLRLSQLHFIPTAIALFLVWMAEQCGFGIWNRGVKSLTDMTILELLNRIAFRRTAESSSLADGATQHSFATSRPIQSNKVQCVRCLEIEACSGNVLPSRSSRRGCLLIFGWTKRKNVANIAVPRIDGSNSIGRPNHVLAKVPANEQPTAPW